MREQLARELVRQAIVASGGRHDAADADNLTLAQVLPAAESGKRLRLEFTRRATGLSFRVPRRGDTIGAIVMQVSHAIPPRLYLCPATIPPHVVTHARRGRCPEHDVELSPGSMTQVLKAIQR